MKGVAIKPKFIPSPFLKEKVPTTKDATQEEQQLAGMGRSAGWKVLKGYINDITSELDLVNETAMAKGANFEELGRNTVVINLAKGVIKKITNRVEDAKEACEGGTKGGKAS